jgi:hypothetical protein
MLVVSLSGISARTLPRCVEFASEMDRREVPLSLLITPAAPALDWVRARAAGGDALVLHGFDHTADPCHRPVALRRAEFSALPAHEAGLRLVAARAALARAGLHTDLFAPPRWLASAGTLTALRRHQFALCAGVAGVHDLLSGTVYAGRVHGLGGVVSESLQCLGMVLGAGRAARRGLARITVDAAALDRIGPRQAVLDAVDAALDHVSPGTYADFVARIPVQRAPLHRANV